MWSARPIQPCWRRSPAAAIPWRSTFTTDDGNVASGLSADLSALPLGWSCAGEQLRLRQRKCRVNLPSNADLRADGRGQRHAGVWLQLREQRGDLQNRHCFDSLHRRPLRRPYQGQPRNATYGPPGYFFRLALMMFGSCAMRDRTLDSCGNPEIEMPMRMCATLSCLSVTVVMPWMLIFSSAKAALTSRTRPRRSKACTSISTGNSPLPIFPQSTASTRAGDFTLSRARLAQA